MWGHPAGIRPSPVASLASGYHSVSARRQFPLVRMIRHFVATAFVVHNGAVLLHWHPKVEAWLPPGGHVEPNEDPVQTVLREIEEETGIAATILPTFPRPPVTSLELLDVPYTIQVEDIPDREIGAHQHIDFIYFALPQSATGQAPERWRWFTRAELVGAVTVQIPSGRSLAPPSDVITVGIAAIDWAERAGRGRRRAYRANQQGGQQSYQSHRNHTQDGAAN